MTLSDLREALHDVLSEVGDEGRPRLYQILRAMAVRAQSGDTKAAALILDRAFGAPQAVQPNDRPAHTIFIGTAPPRDEALVESATNGGAATIE